MKMFWTPEATSMPVLSPFVHGGLLLVLLFLIYSSIKYYKNSLYRRCFKGLQLLQLLCLYSWYLVFSFPLSESLPLYPCRLAMFALLLLPNRNKYKGYFALLAIGGSISAFVYPVFDPYPFPHVTILSFILGHYALLVNAVVYLMSYQDDLFLSLKDIAQMTFSMNALLFLVNQLTGGNYGFLREAPLIHSHHQVFNYFFVSLVLVLMISLVEMVFKISLEKRREKEMKA